MKKFCLAMVLMLSVFAAAGCAGGSQTSGAGTKLAGVASATSSQDTKGESGAPRDYPNKVIELIVPFDAGGATDTYARVLAKEVSKHLPNNQSVVVVNKPGAGGITGATELFKSKGDGYTIGMIPNGVISIQPHFGKTVYNYDSFKPIARAVSSPLLMLVQGDAPWKTFDEWLEYVKANPKKFRYAVGGIGSSLHLAMEVANRELGIETTPVPFDGGANVAAALMGGHVDGAMLGASDAPAQLESGELRVLFNVGSNKNADHLDEAPLLTEVGADVTFDANYSLFAPKDTPDEIVALLHDAFKQTMEEQGVIEQFKKVGLPPGYDSPENVMKEIMETHQRTKPIVEQLGLAKK